MQVKDRIIQIQKTDQSLIKGNYFIVDEYGIEDEEIYHRRIAISEDIYEKFESNLDKKMHLNEFLQLNDIDSEWERYELNIPSSDNAENEVKNSSRLFANIELEKILAQGSELSEQTNTSVYEKVYNELFKKETLINNPLVLDVFNEALRENPESAVWESVFPFFR